MTSGPTLSYPFSFDERVEGAVIATYEGTLHIVNRHDKWDDPEWVIESISLDGTIENPKRREDSIIHQRMYLDVEVQLPEHHPLYAKIVIEFSQGSKRFAIDERWEVVSRRSYAMASL